MLLDKCAIGFFLILIVQHSFAETLEKNEDELDEEFLEILGSIEEENEDWFAFFLSTIDEVEEEQLSETNYE
ncbi:MAG: hypothetical protein AAF304_09005 [Pseudomonadota bacterium]